ncbi:MAG: hypothetical protein RL648_1362 [Verrucomicrobiota bacterium]
MRLLTMLGSMGLLGDGLAQIAPFDGGLHPQLLLLAILVPTACALALMLSGRLAERTVKSIAVLGFVVPAIVAVVLTMMYIKGGHAGGYAFTYMANLGLERFGIRLHLGLNGISLPMYLMAAVVGLGAGLYALQSVKERLRVFMVLLLIMQAGLMGVFSSVDIFFFYFFHEFALIPTFVMIAIWGRAGRRAVALEVTIYLTLGAMITLAGLIYLYLETGAEAFNMTAIRAALLEAGPQVRIFGLLLVGFGILVSLFPFHSWAPRAYATAPAPAAMLHAGVLKKFGLYGLIQIAYPLLPAGASEWAPALLWLALGNIVLIGFVTLAQRDLKLMLGNASVMHMGYAFLGLYAYSTGGTAAAVLMMFAHGVSVALLFLLADVIERRTGTVDMEDIGGLGQKAPVLMGLFVAAMMASIGLPGFANFWGELGIFVALWQSATPWALIPALTGILISAVYGLRAVARVFFGEEKGVEEASDIGTAEKIPVFLLLLVLLLVGFWPRGLSDPVNSGSHLLHAPVERLVTE